MQGLMGMRGSFSMHGSFQTSRKCFAMQRRLACSLSVLMPSSPSRRRAWLECVPRTRATLTLFANHMNANFDLRREVFGDAVLGELNLEMVATARSVGGAHTLSMQSAAATGSQGLPHARSHA